MLGKVEHDDQQLTQYLLGSLPEAEAERLDEMSVADDEIAWRLRAVENDLVDSYVRGELSGPTLDRFKAAYLSSPAKRQKVAIAQALSSAAARKSSANATGERSSIVAWAIAASLVIVIAASYVFMATRRVSTKTREIAVVTSPQVRQAPPPPRGTPRARPAALSFLLPAPTRGTEPPVAIAIPAETPQVVLRLQLESDDFPVYEGALRDLVSNTIVWRSDGVPPSGDPDARTVSISVPASVLKEHNYSLELSGLAAGGRPELIASYVFRVSGTAIH